MVIVTRHAIITGLCRSMTGCAGRSLDRVKIACKCRRVPILEPTGKIGLRIYAVASQAAALIKECKMSNVGKCRERLLTRNWSFPMPVNALYAFSNEL